MSPIELPDPLVLTVGRINLDLYVEQLGTAMADATRFVASVGGSPTNIAIVASRLGVPSALLSAEGGDHAGELVRSRLADFGVDTRWLETIPSGPTSLALLATIEADVGQRQFYRNNPADTFLEPTVVSRLPWTSLQAVVLSGDALASGTTADTVRAVAEQARSRGVEVWWDLDLRPSTWTEEPDRYGDTILPSLEGASVVIGTEEEFARLLGGDPVDLVDSVRALDLSLIVLKLGPRGALLIRADRDDVEVATQSVSPVCTVGGGDSVAGALVAGRLRGMSWEEALDLAMAAAAWTVEQPYCSTGFPTGEQLGLDEPFEQFPLAGTRGVKPDGPHTG